MGDVPVASPPEYCSLLDGGEMRKRIQDFDWTTTSLGPRESWSSCLKLAVNTILTSPFKAGLFWGPERLMLYNDGYSLILGPSHPSALVLNEQGVIEGCLVLCIDETMRFLHERRETCLRELGSRRGEILSVEETCVAAAEVFENAPCDIPFSLVYLRESSDSKTCSLVAASGIPDDHPILEKSAVSCSSPSCLALDSVLQTGEVLELLDLKSYNLPGGVWPENAVDAVIVPLYGASQRTIGAVVLGISPRRKLDDAYRSFHTLVERQFSSNLSIAQHHAAERVRLQEMEQLDRAKTSFFSSISHELRTPLTLILGPVQQLILDSTVSQSVKDELFVINRNARRLLKLVTALLDFSRVEAGRMQAVYRPTDLGPMVKDLCAVFRSAIERAGLAYNVEIDAVADTVYVDAEMIEKIMYNLLSNALKCTFEGSVTVKFGKRENAVFIAVQDTGTGIPDSEVDRIFERFHRVEGGYKRSSEGTGIGLALTQELVKIHGGTISVRSTLGEGSCFTVTLPIGKKHLPADRLDETRPNLRSSSSIDAQFLEEANGWLPERGPSEPAHSREGRTPIPITWTLTGAGGDAAPKPYVLVVDDNRDMATYVKSLLAPHWTVKIARDGQEALEICERHAPGIVVSDVMMPNVDGFELVRRLRANSKLSLTPVILLSARAGEESRAEGLERGADDYLSKPFSGRELVARVRIHLELGRLRGELMHLGKISPVGVFRANLEGRVVYRSERLQEITGQTDLSKHTVHPDDYDRVTEVWKKSLAEQTGGKVDVRYQRPDGTTAWCLAQWQPETDGEGAVVGYLGALTDISERVELQNKQLEEAEENRKSQAAFIDMISHEFRNPLGGVLGNVDLMRTSLERRKAAADAVFLDSVLGPAWAKVVEGIYRHIEWDRESLDAIESCALHQKVIADDVLHISKLKSGTLSGINVVFFPPVMIKKAVGMFSAQMNKKDIAFSVDNKWNEGNVLGDPERLSQVLINLLSNAIKFTERAPKRNIKVSLASVPLPADGDKVCMKICVEDTGIGMTQEAQEKLFERFSQATIRTHREYGGTGLGLHIAKQMLAVMGGDISVESELGKGTTFMFHVPVKRDFGPLGKEDGGASPVSPHLVRSDAIPTPNSTPSPTIPGTPPARDTKPDKVDGTGITVLIVEDNIINQRVLKRQLDILGFTTLVANNGQEAVDICTEAEPGAINVILMDSEMPVKSGIEATKEIRALEADRLANGNAARVPIIGLSGNARGEHREQALITGQNQYLTKPYPLKVLLSAIVDWTGKAAAALNTA
ncbi:hypothetical protein HDU87_006210 [Geranomyces variabilis]|uniref:histidine kinase n=1 Tax=Geranomyces variabilis TaxID=109894 RepID=A0AAD5TI26_9FUNG|nr:hypothetical protein HDU87_006210 [Geranomyces variabilis]